jgi:hypothetical protein
MAKYEVKVTASWWVDVEADSKDEAKEKAWVMDWDDEGSYEGVDEIKVYEAVEQDEGEED